ncbi:MAG: DUF3108 domain-containing protein [Candidatus Acidiferrales bacterium]
MHAGISADSALTQKHRKAAAKAPPKAADVPFQAGEALDYRVSWTAFPMAATVRLSVAERRNLYGWDAWHFRAVASTVPPVRSIFSIDDEFDSYTDAITFAGRRYEMYLDELGRNEKSVMELTPQGAVPRGPVATVIVSPGTRDPLGLLESLRAYDWDHNGELRVPVFDGKNLYEVQASRAMPDSQITVPAGTFSTKHVAIQLFSAGNEVPHTHFDLWLGHDAARIPVAMEADIPIGTFRVELTGLHPGETK